MAPVIWHFIKFFEQESYADAFMAGSLYLNTLAYFKRLESCTDGRMDSNEAVAMWWQPDDLVIRLNVPGIGNTKITKRDLAGPVSMAYRHHDYLHILCLYALYTHGFAYEDGGNISCTAGQVDEVRRQLTIDERCFKFGKFAVITPAVPFLSQLRSALVEHGHKATGRLVEYYDDKTFHGEIPVQDAPFKTQQRFSYQREFRICIDPVIQQAGPLSINVGSLSHICAKVDSARLPHLYDVQFETAPAV